MRCLMMKILNYMHLIIIQEIHRPGVCDLGEDWLKFLLAILYIYIYIYIYIYMYINITVSNILYIYIYILYCI